MPWAVADDTCRSSAPSVATSVGREPIGVGHHSAGPIASRRQMAASPMVRTRLVRSAVLVLVAGVAHLDMIAAMQQPRPTPRARDITG